MAPSPSKRRTEPADVPLTTIPKKKLNSTTAQPTIASFFSRPPHRVAPTQPERREKQSPDYAPPKMVGSSMDVLPAIEDEAKTQLERDAELARSLAGEDDQAYYEQIDRSTNDAPVETTACVVVPEPPKINRGILRNTVSSLSQSQPTIHYPLDSDILDFEPSSIDTSAWPLFSSDNISPKKRKQNEEEGSSSSVMEGLQTRKVPYSFLVAGFVLISGTRSRLTITTVLTNLLRTVIEHDPSSLLPAIYLITNHLGPAYEAIELGVGTQILTKAIKGVSGASSKELKALWNKHGDPGDVAFEARKSVRRLFNSTLQLTVKSVFDDLYKLSGLKGPGTVDTKADVVKKLLISAQGEEVRFLTLCRNLRIGAVKLTVTTSLARAFCLTRSSSSLDKETQPKRYYIPPELRCGIKVVINEDLKGKARAVQIGKKERQEVLNVLSKAETVVREVYARHPNFDDIIPALLDKGCLEKLSERVGLVIGIPISPMLGQITRNLSDVENRLKPEEEFVAEWKYDGQRVQIHARRRTDDHSSGDHNFRGGQWVGPRKGIFVRLFSRHLEDITGKYPDVLDVVVALFDRQAKNQMECVEEAKSKILPEVNYYEESQGRLESFILDAEICAIDPVTGHLKNFQTLSNRSRKDVKIEDVQVQIGIFTFDLMYLNGQSLLGEPFRNRRSLLKHHLPPLMPAKDVDKCNGKMTARFDHVNSLESTVSKLEEVKEFMMEAIFNKCEGIMIKILDSQTSLQSTNGLLTERPNRVDEPEQSDLAEDVENPASDDEVDIGKKDGIKKKLLRKKALLASYEPDKRADSWLKVKKDYGELGDSLDLVPIAAWHGQGRKAGWWSPILLALYDPESGGFQAVCKCISGFSDQFYKDLGVRYVQGTDRCSSETQLGYIESSGGHHPDVWFLPSEVWEIRGADITLSPVYKAAQGLVDPDRGLSLRFPRFCRIRDDKAIEDASHPEDFAELWRRQEHINTN